MRHCCVDISRMNASICALPPEIFGLRRLWSISAAKDLLRLAKQEFVSKFCNRLRLFRSNLWRELDFCKISFMKKEVMVVESKTRDFLQLLELNMDFILSCL